LKRIIKSSISREQGGELIFSFIRLIPSSSILREIGNRLKAKED